MIRFSYIMIRFSYIMIRFSYIMIRFSYIMIRFSYIMIRFFVSHNKVKFEIQTKIQRSKKLSGISSVAEIFKLKLKFFVVINKKLLSFVYLCFHRNLTYGWQIRKHLTFKIFQLLLSMFNLSWTRLKCF